MNNEYLITRPMTPEFKARLADALNCTPDELSAKLKHIHDEIDKQDAAKDDGRE